MKERIEAIRNRLSDFPGRKVKTTDKFGIAREEKAEPLFGEEQLKSFIEQGNSAVALLLDLNFDDVNNSFYNDLIVQYAVIQALSAKALEERGREFALKDVGVDFVPPNISDMLFAQYQLEMDVWMRKIEMLRHRVSTKSPSPVSVSNGEDIVVTNPEAGEVVIRSGSGAMMYSENGAWKAIGSAGTKTTIVPS